MHSSAGGEILFLDDKTENIEAAQSFGWQGVHWNRGMRLDDAIAPFVSRTMP